MREPFGSSIMVLMRCKYMGDGFLWKVLCRFNDQFVVWDFNDQSRGLSSGHYFPNLGSCLARYLELINKSQLLELVHLQITLGENEWEFQPPLNRPFSGIGKIEANLSVVQLRAIFGDPCYEFDGEIRETKSDIEWEGYVGGYQFTIYNYKDGKSFLGSKGKSLDELRDWHIGGSFAAYVPFLVNHKIDVALGKYEESSV